MFIINFCSKIISSNVESFTVGIFSGIVVTFIIPYIARRLKEHSSKFSGYWEQLIYEKGDDNYKGSAIKIDYYKLRHVKLRYSGKLVQNITGEIKRKKPKIGRKWEIFGYLDGDILTMIYQSEEGQKSRGCIYVKMQPDYEFQGFYLEEHKDGVIDKTPLIIRKVQDKKKIKIIKKFMRN